MVHIRVVSDTAVPRTLIPTELVRATGDRRRHWLRRHPHQLPDPHRGGHGGRTRVRSHPVSNLINAPNVFSVMVAVLAGIVGIISLTESRASTLIGCSSR